MKKHLLFLLLFACISAFALLHTAPKIDFEIHSAESMESPNIQAPMHFSLPMPDVLSAHSSSIAPLTDATFLIAYFAGSKEGARDVKIYGNLLMLKKDAYEASTPFEILNRKRLMQDSKEYIKKLGNPLLYSHQGALHLFVVGVSLGGWAGSKIYHYRLESLSHPDFDNRLESPLTPSFKLIYQGALHFSPLLNLSTLVRTAPMDITIHTKQTRLSGFVLPIYHELLYKYPILAFFDSQKLIYAKVPTLHRGLLQPAIAPMDATRFLLAYRSDKSAAPSLYTQVCEISRCFEPQASNLSNLDSSLNLLHHNGSFYLIYNLAAHHQSRAILDLARLDSDPLQKASFSSILNLASTSQENGEVSYPSSLIAGNLLITTYTRDRKGIEGIIAPNALMQKSPSKATP